MDEPVIDLDRDKNLSNLIDTSDLSKPKPEDGEQPPEADPPPVLADPEDA